MKTEVEVKGEVQVGNERTFLGKKKENLEMQVEVKAAAFWT